MARAHMGIAALIFLEGHRRHNVNWLIAEKSFEFCGSIAVVVIGGQIGWRNQQKRNAEATKTCFRCRRLGCAWPAAANDHARAARR